MQKRVVISRGDCDVRVAFLEEGKLVEFHIEHLKDRTIVGNIYRGVVQDVIPGLQAAFVEIGEKRNVFLHFMDVRPEALVMLKDDLDAALAEASETQLPGRIDRPGRRPRSDQRGGSAAAPLKKGDTIIVQVIKDEISDKAPRVSTNLALAGRYLVLLPFPGQTGGVSRRVAMGEERMKLKKLLNDLRTDQYSFIVRTAGVGEDEENIRTDVDLLVGQWDALVQRFRSMKGPGLVHSDSDIVQRLVRDAFSSDIDEVVVDDHDIAEALRLSLSQTLPELADHVMEYDEVEPIFEAYNVEAQMQKALSRKVWLKSGGYLIIEETEALTAIDVNSGRFTGSRDQEKTSFRTNMEACEAIAQQIRLRDIGGIIVVDFIDMLSRENQNTVADEFKHQMRHDRAKYTIGRIGDFGLMTITRKRKHMSLQKQIFDECPYCHGEGLVLSGEEVWRRMRQDLEELAVDRARYSGVVVCCDPFIANKLRTEFAEYLSEFTKDSGLEVILRADPTVHREDYTLTAVEKPTRQSAQLPAKRVDVDELFKAPISWEMRPETNVPPVVPGAAVEETEKPVERRHAPPPPRQQQQGRPQHGRPPQQQRPASTPPPAAKTITPVPKPSGPQAGAPPAEGDAAVAGEAGGRKRKRRGRRGGRGRRKGQQLDANGQPIAASPDQTPLEGEVLDNAAALEGEMPNPDQPLFDAGDDAEDVEELLKGEESNDVEVSEAAPFELEEDEKAAEEVADFAPAVIEHRSPRPARPEREEREEQAPRRDRFEDRGRDRGRDDRGGRFGDRGRDRDRGPRGDRPVPATPDPANKKSKLQVVARFGGAGDATAKVPVKATRPTPDVKALKPIENVTLSTGHRTRAVKILGMWGPQSTAPTPAPVAPAAKPVAAPAPPVAREGGRPQRPPRPERGRPSAPAPVEPPTPVMTPDEALAVANAAVAAEAAEVKTSEASPKGGRPRKSAKKAAKVVAPPAAKKAVAKPASKPAAKPAAVAASKKAAKKAAPSKPPVAKAAAKPASKAPAKSAVKPAAKKAAKKAARSKS